MLYIACLTIALIASALAFPAWRRVMIFHLNVAKYIGIWLLDAVRIRHIWLRLRGRRPVPIDVPFLVRRFCEDMGPTFIKFGQIVASSSGMFPDRYVEEFQKCLDRVRPIPFKAVQKTLIEELGEDKAKTLRDIDSEPLASASIAQVHTAKLGDGTSVVVKVQRPGIAEMVETDVYIMKTLARVMQRLVRDAELANPVGIVDDFAATLTEELDFRQEARNLRHFNEIMDQLGQERVRSPKPFAELTAKRVLVMERFSGTRVDHAEEITNRGIDAEEALIVGLRAWLQCVVLHGFFHGDVHAGNLMLLDDGDIGFLDFGIIGRFSDEQRRLVTDYMLSFSTGDYRKLARVIVDMGGVPQDLEMDSFVEDLAAVYAPIRNRAFGEVNYAELVPDVQRVATKHRMGMPREFVLILKQFLYFDRYAKLLAPKLNVFTHPRLILGLMGDIQRMRSAASHDAPQLQAA